MGYNHAFLIALIFFATANRVSHAQPILGLPLPNLRNVTVRGLVCCTPTGTCTVGSPPVAGALVDLNCTNLITGTVQRIGQAITTGNGSFSITVNLTTLLNLGNLLGGCTVRVALPLNETICPVLSNVTGALVGIIGPITLLLNQLIATVLSLVRVSL